MKTLAHRPLLRWAAAGVFCFFVGCRTPEARGPEPASTRLGPPEAATAEQLGALSKESEDFSEALAHYVTGLLHLSKGEANEALEEWRQVVALDPGRSDLRERVVQEYFRRGEFAQAVEILRAAVQKLPESAPEWMLLAVALRADKQWDAATEAAARALRLAPDKFPPYEVLFDAEVERNDLAGAKRVLDRAAKHPSNDYRYWIRLAELCAALGARDPAFQTDPEQIMRFYDRTAELQPSDPMTLARVADYYVANQHTEKAITLYQKVLDQDPGADGVRLKLALSFVARGNKAGAIAILEEWVKLEPLRWQILNVIGEIYEDTRDFENALKNYRLSLQANPNQLPPCLRSVLILMRTHRLDEALSLLDAAKDRFPETPQITYFYGLVYSDRKDFVNAAKFLEETERLAAVSTPGLLDAVFHFYYGAALERNGKYDLAVAQFRKAIEQNPDYADACNYLGYLFAERGANLEEAEQLVQRALALEPNNGAFLDSLGWVYYRQRRFPEALAQLQRAAALIAHDPVIHEHLGEVYRALGAPAQALLHFDKAAELDPKNAEMAEKIEGLKREISARPAPTAAP
ncbi:MAG: tetratricopeptide repeat protein [Verrucomicrobiae bacterium]|nr:tetratricopeptide repeat protein [Verrucomicrobiae bacterium]